MRRHFRLAPLLVLISALLLLAPVLASAQTRQMGRSVSLNGTVFSLDYASQFEQAVVRISRAGQSDVWTQTFPAGSSIIADLGILIGSPVADGLYRYEVELTWPGNPQPQVTSGRLKIAGGQIQAGEPKGRKSISPDRRPRPTPLLTAICESLVPVVLGVPATPS